MLTLLRGAVTYAAVHARTGVHVVLAAHRAVANGLRVNGRRGAHPASGTFFFLRCLFRSQSKRRFPLNGALLRLGHGVVLPLSGDVFRVGAFVLRVAINPSGNVILPLFFLWSGVATSLDTNGIPDFVLQR